MNYENPKNNGDMYWDVLKKLRNKEMKGEL